MKWATLGAVCSLVLVVVALGLRGSHGVPPPRAPGPPAARPQALTDGERTPFITVKRADGAWLTHPALGIAFRHPGPAFHRMAMPPRVAALLKDPSGAYYADGWVDGAGSEVHLTFTKIEDASSLERLAADHLTDMAAAIAKLAASMKSSVDVQTNETRARAGGWTARYHAVISTGHEIYRSATFARDGHGYLVELLIFAAGADPGPLAAVADTFAVDE